MLKQKILIGILFLALTGCGGDSSTGPGQGEPPQVPDLTAAQPDFSYFEQAQKTPEKLKVGDAYGSASGTVLGAGFLFGMSQMGTSYFGMAENEQAVYKDGQWVWTYETPYEGQSLKVELTSKVNEDANEAKWALFMTSTGGEVNYDNFKLTGGTVSLDGKKGDWSFYTLTETGSSETVMSYEWNTDTDGNLTATFSFPEDDSFSSMEYVEDGPIHTLTLAGTDGNTVVYWDTENDHGYWEESGEQLCWTSDKSDIACNDIGL